MPIPSLLYLEFSNFLSIGNTKVLLAYALCLQLILIFFFLTMLVYFATTLAQKSVSHNRNFLTVLEVRNPTSGCQQRSGSGEDSAQMPTTVKLREDSAFDLQRATFLPTFTQQTMRQEASLRVSSYRGRSSKDPILKPSYTPRNLSVSHTQCHYTDNESFSIQIL